MRPQLGKQFKKAGSAIHETPEKTCDINGVAAQKNSKWSSYPYRLPPIFTLNNSIFPPTKWSFLAKREEAGCVMF